MTMLLGLFQLIQLQMGGSLSENVIIIGVPLLAGFIGWLTHEQFRQWVAIHDLQAEIGMPDAKGNVKEGSLRDRINDLRSVSNNTNEQVTEIREALIKTKIIEPKKSP